MLPKSHTGPQVDLSSRMTSGSGQRRSAVRGHGLFRRSHRLYGSNRRGAEASRQRWARKFELPVFCPDFFTLLLLFSLAVILLSVFPSWLTFFLIFSYFTWIFEQEDFYVFFFIFRWYNYVNLFVCVNFPTSFNIWHLNKLNSMIR